MWSSALFLFAESSPALSSIVNRQMRDFYAAAPFSSFIYLPIFVTKRHPCGMLLA